MAFLGSIGKSLGLSSSFGQGLAEGLATSIDKGLQSDMKRTQDNIDNLVEVSYKGGAVESARFKKEFKENEDAIKEIAGLVGGEQGTKHPLAYQATQSLITQYGGLAPALNKAKRLKNYQNLYTTSPIELMKMESNGEKSVITSKLLAESLTTPVTLPNMKKLGESANVGFMKSNWFGPASDASSEIETRSNALLEASGIDINERVLGTLPPSVESNIDPLILGTQDNPTAELIRLQRVFQANNALGDDKDIDKQNTLTTMIDNVQSLIQSATTKKRMTDTAFNSHIKGNLEKLGTVYNLGLNYKSIGSFPDVAGTKEKKLLALSTSRYYTNILAQATLKGDPNVLYINTVLEALSENKELIATTNDAGVFTLEKSDKNYLSEVQVAELNAGNSKDLNLKGLPGTLNLDKVETAIIDGIKKGNGNLDSRKKQSLKNIYVQEWKKKNSIDSVKTILDKQNISYTQLAYNKFKDFYDGAVTAGQT